MSQPADHLQWDYPSPFVMDFEPAEEHIDELNHVNNSVYVNWCQEMGWAHSRFLGIDMAVYNQLDRAMVIRHSAYDYCAAAYLGQPLCMGTWLTRSDGKLTMERHFELKRVDDGVTLLRGNWQLVCVQISTGKPKRMPEVFRSGYGRAVLDSSYISE